MCSISRRNSRMTQAGTVLYGFTWSRIKERVSSSAIKEAVRTSTQPLILFITASRKLSKGVSADTRTQKGKNKEEGRDVPGHFRVHTCVLYLLGFCKSFGLRKRPTYKR